VKKLGVQFFQHLEGHFRGPSRSLAPQNGIFHISAPIQARSKFLVSKYGLSGVGNPKMRFSRSYDLKVIMSRSLSAAKSAITAKIGINSGILVK